MALLERGFVDKVNVTPGVCRVCLTHAYLTDKEEIMGVLYGRIFKDGEFTVADVLYALPLERSDKKKDRVETDANQLAMASEFSDELLKYEKGSFECVGWYHSHPRITVWPSAVDLQTQAQYQMTAPWIGLIVSCFTGAQGQDSLGTTELTCFQTGPGMSPRKIPIQFLENEVFPVDDMIRHVPQRLIEENEKAFQNITEFFQSHPNDMGQLYNATVKQLSLLQIHEDVVRPLQRSRTEARLDEELLKELDTLKKKHNEEKLNAIETDEEMV